MRRDDIIYAVIYPAIVKSLLCIMERTAVRRSAVRIYFAYAISASVLMSVSIDRNGGIALAVPVLDRKSVV